MGLNFRILSGFIVAIISFNHLKLGIFYLVKKKLPTQYGQEETAL